MSFALRLALGVLLFGSSAAAQTSPATPSRRVGVHIGLNGTLTADLALGRFFYGGVSTQLTGLAALAEPQRNYVVSALVFAGVALPLVERESLRLTADVTPSVGWLYSAPVNMVSAGLLAGVRLVHRSGFTAALRLPLVGYAGSPQVPRGSLYYYYITAIPTAPLLTLGYTF